MGIHARVTTHERTAKLCPELTHEGALAPPTLCDHVTKLRQETHSLLAVTTERLDRQRHKNKPSPIPMRIEVPPLAVLCQLGCVAIRLRGGAFIRRRGRMRHDNVADHEAVIDDAAEVAAAEAGALCGRRRVCEPTVVRLLCRRGPCKPGRYNEGI